MSLKMRELRGDDLFTLLSLFEKLDVVDDIVEIFSGTDTQEMTPELITARGKKIIGSLLQKLLENLPKVKTEINQLLADLTGKSIEEISALPFGQYIQLIKDFIKKAEFTDFLSSIA